MWYASHSQVQHVEEALLAASSRPVGLVYGVDDAGKWHYSSWRLVPQSCEWDSKPETEGFANDMRLAEDYLLVIRSAGEPEELFLPGNYGHDDCCRLGLYSNRPC